jgi:hypothetical protein
MAEVDRATLGRAGGAKAVRQSHIEGSIQTRAEPHSASVVQIETGRLVPWLMFCSVLAGLAVGIGVLALSLGQKSEREARMLQYYVLEMDAKLIAAGVKKPDEAVSKQLEN